jgi:hypothetical protein
MFPKLTLLLDELLVFKFDKNLFSFCSCSLKKNLSKLWGSFHRV